MRRAWSYAIVGVVAFVIGVVVAGAVLVAPEDAGPTASGPEIDPETAPQRGGIRARRHTTEPSPTPVPTAVSSAEPRSASSDGGVTAASLGTPASAAELEFLRTALAEERARLEQSAADAAEREREARLQSDDDGLEILDRYLRHGGSVDDVVNSFAAMRAHINTVQEPVRRFDATGARTSVDLSDVIAEDVVLEFGEGEFVLERGTASWNVRDEDVESLEIRGAGMDKTKLIGPGWAFLCAGDTSHIRNLVIRDLTIDALEKKQIVLDARGGISAALERVRVEGWVVAGHASALGVSGDAFFAARDCEFDGEGWVLSLRGPGLAVFERCTFSSSRAVVIASSHRKGRPAVVRLNDCEFGTVKVADRDLRTRGAGGADVEVRGGTAAAGPASWTEAERIKNFGATDVVSMDGLTFVTTPPTFSVEDAAIAFDVAAASGLRNVVGVRVGVPGRKPVELDFYVIDGEPGSAPVRQTRIYDGTSLRVPSEKTRRGAHGVNAVDLADLQRAQAFSTLLRNAEIAADENVSSVSFHAYSSRSDDPDALSTLVVLAELEGKQRVTIDAVTGSVLRRR